jgi:hypothetical protein
MFLFVPQSYRDKKKGLMIAVRRTAGSNLVSLCKRLLDFR